MGERPAHRPGRPRCASSPSWTAACSSRPAPARARRTSSPRAWRPASRAGTYEVEHMAAVTFTRKAAAELRGRFQLALEEELAALAGGASGSWRGGLQPARDRRAPPSNLDALWQARALLRRHHPLLLRAPAARASGRGRRLARVRRARRGGGQARARARLARLPRRRRWPMGEPEPHGRSSRPASSRRTSTRRSRRSASTTRSSSRRATRRCPTARRSGRRSRRSGQYARGAAAATRSTRRPRARPQQKAMRFERTWRFATASGRTTPRLVGAADALGLTPKVTAHRWDSTDGKRQGRSPRT